MSVDIGTQNQLITQATVKIRTNKSFRSYPSSPPNVSGTPQLTKDKQRSLYLPTSECAASRSCTISLTLALPCVGVKLSDVLLVLE